MIGLILVTHGKLADEFLVALEHVVGPQSQVETVCIGPRDDVEGRRKEIATAIKRVDTGEGVIILTDLFGGTPSNLAISLMEKGKVEVIAGINLPMLIRLAKARGCMELKQAVTDFKAKAGGVVVVDTKTGEILALANWPTYNPNNRENLSGAQLRNRALTDTFEPGSVMKPVTMAIAIDQGEPLGPGARAGALTGGRTHSPRTIKKDSTDIINNMLSIIIDPDSMGGTAFYEDEVDNFIGWVKSARPQPGVDEGVGGAQPQRPLGELVRGDLEIDVIRLERFPQLVPQLAATGERAVTVDVIGIGTARNAAHRPCR